MYYVSTDGFSTAWRRHTFCSGRASASKCGAKNEKKIEMYFARWHPRIIFIAVNIFFFFFSSLSLKRARYNAPTKKVESRLICVIGSVCARVVSYIRRRWIAVIMLLMPTLIWTDKGIAHIRIGNEWKPRTMDVVIPANEMENTLISAEIKNRFHTND